MSVASAFAVVGCLLSRLPKATVRGVLLSSLLWLGLTNKLCGAPKARPNERKFSGSNMSARRTRARDAIDLVPLHPAGFDMLKKSRIVAASVKRKNRLPVAMDVEDCQQEAALFMLEHPDMPEKYFSSVLDFRVMDAADRMWVGPKWSVRYAWAQKGVSHAYGEIGLEDLPPQAGTVMSERADDYEDHPFALTAERAAECLKVCQAILDRPDDESGVVLNRRSGKFYVTVFICKNRQFVGSYATKSEGTAARNAFITAFMAMLLDSIKNETYL